MNVEEVRRYVVPESNNSLAGNKLIIKVLATITPVSGAGLPDLLTSGELGLNLYHGLAG